MSINDPFVRLMEQARGLSIEAFVEMIEGQRRAAARDFVSIKDLAAELGVSVRTLRRRNNGSDAPSRVKRGRRLLYRRADVQHWFNQSQGSAGHDTSAGD